MSLSGKQWVWPRPDQNLVHEMARSLNITPALATLFINRGINDPAEARAFLCPSLDQLCSPWRMAGMEKAVARLMEALRKDEKIMVHGDYDADGITATVILVEALRLLGGRVDYYLPSRFNEGYGLHLEVLKSFRDQGTHLVITVDCGINAVEEVGWAAENGLDIIITDHHQPLTGLQGAVAAINPLQEQCPYPFKELSGSGIAFKVASALMEKAKEPFPEELLDLAALGTTADVVPLLGENRIIVHHGLSVLRRMRRVGFKALAEAVGLNEQKITSTSLSFALAPAINAAGRMGEALPAAQLLLAEDRARAQDLAESLHRANQLRRATEQKILLEAEEAAIDLLSKGDQKIITLAGAGWHHGVIGIVASRLVDKYNRPFCLIALEDGEGRGSARSIPGFHITAALSECASLLERFGGHDQAAGFTVRADRVDALRNCLNRYAGLKLEERDLKPRLFIETELEDADITFDFTARLEELQPFGTANPAPLFVSRDWQLHSWRLVGADQKHLKLQLKKGNRSLDPIFFSGSFLEPKLEKGRRLDVALKLRDGYFRNQKTLEAEVKDLSYNDSYKSGELEVIDRRHLRDRLAAVSDIIDRNGKNGLVFVSTASRAEQIRKSCFLGDLPRIITGGSINGGGPFSAGPGPVILYDLPLYDGILKHIFSRVYNDKAVAVYLFYGREDLERNRRLLELSLPTPEALEIIANMVLKNPGAITNHNLPDLAAGSLVFKPAPSFWERVEKIFHEIGYLKEGVLDPQGAEIMKRWPSCLDSSEAYLSTADLREKCERFQAKLLEAAPRELASLLHDQAFD